MLTLKVLDMKGVEIKEGDSVKVHQNDVLSIADVIKVGTTETRLKPGYWVDIDKGDGVEGMMSYILEVVDGN